MLGSSSDSTHVSNAGESAQDLGMIASQNVTFKTRITFWKSKHKTYLGDTKVFQAELQSSFGLPSYALYNGKGKLVAYAECCSRWYSISPTKWEVRLGGKHGPPIAHITYTGSWWVKLMSDNEAERLRIDNCCCSCTSFPIIKNGAVVARFTRTKWTRGKFKLWVRKGEHLWVLLLLFSLIKGMTTAENSM